FHVSFGYLHSDKQSGRTPGDLHSVRLEQLEVTGRFADHWQLHAGKPHLPTRILLHEGTSNQPAGALMPQITPLKLVEFLVQYSFFLISVAVHESSHAWTAYRYGDPTAKMQNRISLNPLNHIDILGTVILPLFAFISGIPVIGWAKPTPVNTANLRDPRKD